MPVAESRNDSEALSTTACFTVCNSPQPAAPPYDTLIPGGLSQEQPYVRFGRRGSHDDMQCVVYSGRYRAAAVETTRFRWTR